MAPLTIRAVPRTGTGNPAGFVCWLLIPTSRDPSRIPATRTLWSLTDRPESGLVVALTGTDLYRDIHSDTLAYQSLELATCLVVLQESGVKELEPRYRSKTRVIYQSAEPVRLQPPAKKFFAVCVIGNLRAEKDPFRCALAARLLPPTPHVRVTHVGRPYNEEFAEEARVHMASSPRYRWLGEVPRWKARRILSRSRLLAQISVMEGGANAVSEALAAGVPVVGSNIPGNVGMLGEAYPGYYEVGRRVRFGAVAPSR